MKHAAATIAAMITLTCSASAQGLGVLSDDYWQDAQTRAAIKGVRTCWLVGNDASRIVLRRYAGASMSDAMGEAFYPEQQAMVTAAYGMQRMASATFQQQQEKAFNDAWQARCFERMGTGG